MSALLRGDAHAYITHAFLHLAPCPSDLQYNRRFVDRAVTAAAYGATWILTPELCICGYDCTDDLGTARQSSRS